MAVAVLIVGSDSEQIQATSECLEQLNFDFTAVVSHANFEGALEHLKQSHNLASDLWLWPLAAGQIPDAAALHHMLDVSERSPSAAWILPKLMRQDRPREILEYGLTVGRAWAPLSLAAGEFDQSQHDGREEFLAASPWGSLFKYQSFLAAGGLQQGASDLANNFRLAVALRMANSRIIGAPMARVLTPPTLPTLASASEFELRKIQIQLLTGYLNPILSLLLGFFAPAVALLLAVWQLLLKRPERIGPTIGAALWWFGAGFWLVGRRPKTRISRAGAVGLRGLRASREDHERIRRSRVDQPGAIAEAAVDAPDSTLRFVAAQGPWIMVALAALSWKFWPGTGSVTGGGLLPLGGSLAHLFSRAGASWQLSGFGFAAPSDPFNWVLFALGSVTFWAPSLSLALLVFLAKPLAFAAAWRMLSLTTNRAWIATLGALAYALWPALGNAQLDGNLGTLVALVLLPWFVFTLARILRFGASERRSVQTWTWVGISAILAACIGAGAPSLTPLVTIIILFLAVYRFRRIGYLVWLPIPLIVVWAPYAWYLAAGLGHPALILTEPGLSRSGLLPGANIAWMKMLLGTALPGALGAFALYAVVPLLVLGVLATLGRRHWQALWLMLAYCASVATAWAYSNFTFQSSVTAYSQAQTHGSPLALLGLAGLVLVVAAVLALDSATRAWRGIAGFVVITALVALAAAFTLAPSQLIYTDGSQMPALVEAQVQANPATRVLVITPQASTNTTQRVSGALVTGSGVWLEDLSTAYNYSLAGLAAKDIRYRDLARLVANLVSANGTNFKAEFARFGIDYVLLPNPQASGGVASALQTVSQLEAVGDTDYGRLWRVAGAPLKRLPDTWQWSITKQIQVGVLAVFALLAIPTRRRIGSSNGQSDLDEDLAEGFQQEGY